MNETIKILLVEDDEADVLLFEETLKQVPGFTFKIYQASQLKQAIDILAGNKIDIVLLDLGLPDANGMKTVIETHLNAPQVPIIVLTGLDDEATAYRAVREGVQDYLIKGEIKPSLLARSIRYAIERKRTEDQIKKSLLEKELLLKELHHRVKNNLQTILSLLSLQSEYTTEKPILEAFEKSKSRINSILLVHEQLYLSNNPTEINFREYVDKLCVNLFHAYGVDANLIKLKIQADDILLGVDQAIPCGIILNEIISNSLKHAFKDKEQGEIEISIKESENILIELKDNGTGFNYESESQSTETLGLQLVKKLVKNELHGEIEYVTGKGTFYKISMQRIAEK